MKTNLIFSLALIFNFLTQEAYAEVSLYDQSDLKIKLGGFVEFDALFDSSRSVGESEGSVPIARRNTFDGENGRTQFSLRNSRIALGAEGPAFTSWKPRAVLEMDFLGYDPAALNTNNQSETSFYSSPSFRIRHAFIQLKKNSTEVIVGQTWSLFGWQPFYVPNTVSVPPSTGTVFERTQRISVIQNFSPDGDSPQVFRAGLALVRPTQRDAQLPNVDAGIIWSLESRRSGFSSVNSDIRNQPLSLALSTTFREFKAPRAGNSVSDLVSTPAFAFALDTFIPLLACHDPVDTAQTLSLIGEYTFGRGYGDEFPNWNGGILQNSVNNQTSNTVGSNLNLDAGIGGYNSRQEFELVHLQSFSTQLQYHLSQSAFFTFGYAQVYSNNLSNFLSGPGVTVSKLYDRSEIYFLNWVHDLSKQVRVGLEFSQFATHYVSDGAATHQNRIAVATYYRF